MNTFELEVRWRALLSQVEKCPVCGHPDSIRSIEYKWEYDPKTMCVKHMSERQAILDLIDRWNGRFERSR